MSVQTPAMKAEIQDYTKALEVLEKDYPTRDGLDVNTLLDSDKHGALTYNDFLILPGYIGESNQTPKSFEKIFERVKTNLRKKRIPCL